MHARQKCCDGRFAANHQNIFHVLRDTVASSDQFSERKLFKCEINVG